MAIVYRFEDRMGCGPFGATRAAYAYDLAKPEGMPSAFDPPCLWDMAEEGTPAHAHHKVAGLEGYHFGFATLAQLRRWFRSAPGRRAMAKAGMKLVKYDVPEDAILHANTQLIFRRDLSEVLDELDPVTLKHKEA